MLYDFLRLTIHQDHEDGRKETTGGGWAREAEFTTRFWSASFFIFSPFHSAHSMIKIKQNKKPVYKCKFLFHFWR